MAVHITQKAWGRLNLISGISTNKSHVLLSAVNSSSNNTLKFVLRLIDGKEFNKYNNNYDNDYSYVNFNKAQIFNNDEHGIAIVIDPVIKELLKGRVIDYRPKNKANYDNIYNDLPSELSNFNVNTDFKFYEATSHSILK
jgi:hypothetical protein